MVLDSDIAVVRAWVAEAIRARIAADEAAGTPVAREFGLGPQSYEMEFFAGAQLVTVAVHVREPGKMPGVAGA